MIEDFISYLSQRSVLLLGFGREGKSSYTLIRKYLPEKEIGIADRRTVTLEDSLVNLHCGENYLDAMAGYDLVIKSPGISLAGVALPQNVEISCQTDLFLRFAPCVCIGVTGTKGKTTTSTLIYQMLCSAGLSASLIGNMGLPVLDSIEDISGKYAVIELSSHQLEFMTCSPHIAILTNIYPEHLDHYNGFAGYVDAKLNIQRYQGEQDYFIYTAEQDLCAFLDWEQVQAKRVPVPAESTEAFLCELAPLNERLKGKHNAHNIAYAAAAVRLLGVSDEAIREAVATYGGIEHRMEPVGEYKGIRFYNDCIATIPHSVMCAVEALGEVDSLIFGGMDRGLDYAGFAVQLEKSMVQNLIALPDTGHKILRAMGERGTKKQLLFAKDMEEAVRLAYRHTQQGKICLLSPAASSYNVYRDFAEKGQHYKDLVCALGTV